ncbi:MAG: 16S rRNA (adenine(1518)-N(6)/adenine(1519)-N(6))-dimethyltransferase RsmA [Minisyncoccia bacterium]
MKRPHFVSHGVRAKKSLGQNFLMHARIAERIADVAQIPETGTVLEIGPGTGKLTKPLLVRAARVIAVEADAELLSRLEVTFAKEVVEGRCKLIHGDIRTFDLAHLQGPYQLVANIPYYLTGEILRQFLSAKKKPTSMTLLVQKEVAERIARSKKESLLSLSVKIYGTPKYEFSVPRGAFTPAPNVDSAVLSIQNIRNDVFSSPEQEAFFFDVLHAGFAHKRKRLAGNLSVFGTRDEVREALISAGIAENARAEDVPLASWRELVTCLARKRSVR